MHCIVIFSGLSFRIICSYIHCSIQDLIKYTIYYNKIIVIINEYYK